MKSSLFRNIGSLALALAAPTILFSADRTAAPWSPGDGTPVVGGEECDGGVVKDDGTMETAYGWVPSVIDGRYVQRFEASEFRSRKMEEICICWTRTQADDSVSFLVQLYRDRGGRPARSPAASLQAEAIMVPAFPDGAFYSIDVSSFDFHGPTQTFYLGVQWNPSEDGFFFICADQTDATPVVDGFFVDDRAEDWTSVFETTDPIFDEHRAMMIRARALEGYYPLVPTLGTWGLLILIAAICVIGVLVVRRQETGG